MALYRVTRLMRVVTSANWLYNLSVCLSVCLLATLRENY